MQLGTTPRVRRARFTFHLRPSILWHDGVPFTSDDVKFTYDYIKALTDSWLHPNIENVDHVDALDPLTVAVYMNTLSVYDLHRIQVPILPRHIWESIADPHGFSPDPLLIGCGPWIFDSYVVGSFVTLNANRNYYMYNHPKPDVNWDGIVDIYDIITVAVAFGSEAGEVNWDSKADVTPDWYLVDVYDLILVAVNFGITWGP